MITIEFNKKNEETEINILLKKYKGLLKNKERLARFKEPVLLLIRRNMKVEFFENQVGQKFEFEHTDGEDRYITLDSAQLLTFPYGSTEFRGYLCFEDEAMPYPHRPILYSQSVQVLIDKIMNDIKTWKAKEWEAKGNFYWKIGLGIGAIILAYALYVMLKPTPTTVIQTVQNITPMIPVG